MRHRAERRAGASGGALANINHASGSGDTFVRNCILWNNAAPTGADLYQAAGTLSVSYSDYGASSGIITDAGGNINSAPLFVAAAANNLRLLAGSPAIDASPPLGAREQEGARGNKRRCYDRAYSDVQLIRKAGIGH